MVIMFTIKEINTDRFWNYRVGASAYPEVFITEELAKREKNLIESKFQIEGRIEIVPCEVKLSK